THGAEDRGNSDEAERADHRDLDRAVSARARIERSDAALDEMNVFDRMKVILDDRAPRERDDGQMRRQLPKTDRIQAGKKPIPDNHGTPRPTQACGKVIGANGRPAIGAAMPASRRMRAAIWFH